MRSVHDPVAWFTIEHGAGVVLVDAIDSSSLNGAILRYHWDFGDGHAYWGDDWEVHVYDDPFQDHMITLTVVDVIGARAVTGRVVPGADDPLEAMITVWSDGGRIWLDGFKSDAGAFSIVRWTWDLGDGSAPREGPVVEHRFNEPGRYEIRLEVEDETGRSATAVHRVEVENGFLDSVRIKKSEGSGATMRLQDVPGPSPLLAITGVLGALSLLRARRR